MFIHPRRAAAVAMLCWAMAALPTGAELMAPKSREPQFPPKAARTLWSAEEIATARDNIARFPAAKALADGVVARADRWMAWEDERLRGLVTTADVPRAFNDATAGCPKCGKAIFEKGGTYPWIITPEKPFQITCPVDGTSYPSNDFAAYYATGMTDRSLLTGDFADDGWGWVSPSGEKHWFVAHANHWLWMDHIIPGALDLGRAATLTGNPAYGRKAAVLLDRIAEVYPNMDHHPQSRYGQLQAARGARYEGKILNHIWETVTLTSLAEAYDHAWEHITDETVAGKTAAQVRANIEANLLEEGIDGYFSGKIRGNFGMHQKALIYAGLTRQFGRQDEWFDGIMNEAAGGEAVSGLNYALYNLVYRDGPPFETAPGYNFSWVANLTTIAESLHRAGRDVYAIPKVKRLYDGVLDVVNVGMHTPSVGDSGSVYGGFVGRDAWVYQRAYQAFGEPRYRDHLQGFKATGESGFIDFESLFAPPVPTGDPAINPVRSRLLDGYGMAILNNPANTVSLALYYGYMGGHGHYDRLNFELYANELVMMPDLGYPDFMNVYVPGIYTWSKITAAHNTVTVDATRQPRNYPGTVHRFVDGDFARALDIDAAPTYPQLSEYRRRLVMVDLDGANSYVVDCFTAKGGGQHDYALHGPPGTFAPINGAWSDPAPGTLAGPEVPLEHIYDDATLAAPDYSGGYADYCGSGFQHFFNVQRLASGAAAGEWTHEKNSAAKLRIHRVDLPGESILADAFISPVKYRQPLKYFIGRNSGADLASRFVSVLEPCAGTLPLAAVGTLALSEGDGVAVVADLGAGRRDVIVINTGGAAIVVEGAPIRTDAAVAVVRLAGEAVERAWFSGGSFLEAGGRRVDGPPAITGEVAAVDPAAGRVHIASAALPDDLAALVGKTIHFQNDLRRAAHPIAAIEKSETGCIVTVGDDLLVGRVRAGELRPEGFTTATSLAFAPVYDGAWIADMAFSQFAPIEGVKRGVVTYARPGESTLAIESGQDAWIVNVGPGDRVEIPLGVESATP